jgi:hypothetical protein
MANFDATLERQQGLKDVCTMGTGDPASPMSPLDYPTDGKLTSLARMFAEMERRLRVMTDIMLLEGVVIVILALLRWGPALLRLIVR